MNKHEIDLTDRRILGMLQENARISNAEIARRIGMTPSGVLDRIRKLESRGVILGYEVRIDPKALGHHLTAFTYVRSEEKPGSIETGALLAEIPEVVEVHHTAGQDCYLIKVRVSDTDEMSALLKKFGRIESVRDTRTTIVLTTVKETIGRPANRPEDEPLAGSEPFQE